MNKILKIIGVAAVVALVTKITGKKDKGRVKNDKNIVNSSNNSTPKGSDYAKNNKDKKTSIKNKSSSQNTTTKQTGKAASDFSNARTQKMYKDLGMTKDQQRRYEADYGQVIEDWSKTNPGKDMSDQELTDQHNAALNAILNEDQYGIYRTWNDQNQ